MRSRRGLVAGIIGGVERWALAGKRQSVLFAAIATVAGPATLGNKAGRLRLREDDVFKFRRCSGVVANVPDATDATADPLETSLLFPGGRGGTSKDLLLLRVSATMVKNYCAA